MEPEPGAFHTDESWNTEEKEEKNSELHGVRLGGTEFAENRTEGGGVRVELEDK